MSASAKSPASVAVRSSAGTISIRVNDEPRSLAGGSTVADLVHQLGLGDKKGVAIAVNSGVVARAAWPVHVLAEGDRVLVIRATQGG